MFDQGLAKEITDMKEVFNQMETKVEQCSVERKYFEIEKKELFIEYDRLLEHIICQDIMCIAMHADFEHNCVLPANANNLEYAQMEQSFIDEYSRCLELEAEVSKKKDMVEKDVYNEISKRSLRLEQHCINLEITVQQMKESLRNQKPCKNQDALEFPEFFETNELKAQLQKKTTTISHFKDHIATLKGKSMSDCIVPVNNSCVIAPEMYKLDLQPLSPKLRNNREVHVDYLKQTKKHADTLCNIVEQTRALQPLDSALDYSCKFTTRVKSSTSASGSKPSGNTKKNGISSGWTFTIDGTKCPLTRITSTTVVPPKKPILAKVVKKTPPSRNNPGKPKAPTSVVQIVLWYLDSGCSKHMTGQRSQLINFVSKFMGTVRFRNDQVAAIIGYGDYNIGNVTISLGNVTIS
ncbi:hypothetical protein Tco_1079121 [Tanacetum coccineum]|uniref:Retrovirus-related Pol polyprotein from transposon TNT 1-94-like beta-barrel domain-containing protein n=1 Tax=Tanacetum coccineum TaxID=301880 RepID=A0ABQ5HQX0_9ASTR